MVAINVIGNNSGTVVGLSLLFYFTKNLDPKWAYFIVAVIPIIFSFSVFLSVKEPQNLLKSEEKCIKKQSFFKKVI